MRQDSRLQLGTFSFQKPALQRLLLFVTGRYREVRSSSPTLLQELVSGLPVWLGCSYMFELCNSECSQPIIGQGVLVT